MGSIEQSATHELIHRLISIKSGYDVTGLPRLNEAKTRVYNNLLRMVDETSVKYSISFTSLARQLELNAVSTNNNDPETNRDLVEFRAIGAKLFEGGCRTWGRVISLVALTCQMAVSRAGGGSGGVQEVEHMINAFSSYLDEECGVNMRHLGGWESFEKVFPDPDLQQATTLKWLLGSAVVLGLSSLQQILAAH